MSPRARAGDTGGGEETLSGIVAFFRYFWWDWGRSTERQREVDAAVGEALPHSALLILHRLEQHGPMTVVDLARLLRLDASTVSRQLGPLRQRGLLRQIPSERDRRAAVLHLTPAGRLVGRRVEQAQVAQWADNLRGLTPGERRTLAALLEKVRLTMEHDAPGTATRAMRAERPEPADPEQPAAAEG